MRPDFVTYLSHLNPADPDDESLVRRFLTELDPHDATTGRRAATGPVDGYRLGSDRAIAAAVRESLANPDGYLRDAAISFRTLGFPARRRSLPDAPSGTANSTRTPPSATATGSPTNPRRDLVIRAAPRTSPHCTSTGQECSATLSRLNAYSRASGEHRVN